MSFDSLPAWGQVQKRTFTRWANTHLQKRGLQIDDMGNDLSNGVLLINLLEEVSGKSLGKYNRTAKLQPQKMENADIALSFLKKEGMKLVGVGVLDIVDSYAKMILGMFWTVIQHYQIAKNKKAGSAKEEILSWINTILPEFGIKNFKSDWKSGKAFCAVVNHFQPGAVDFGAFDESNALESVTHAAEVAEKELNIPSIMAPADMVSDDIDDLSVLTYLSYFRAYDQERSGDSPAPAAAKSASTKADALPEDPTLAKLDFSGLRQAPDANGHRSFLIIGPKLKKGWYYDPLIVNKADNSEIAVELKVVEGGTYKVVMQTDVEAEFRLGLYVVDDKGEDTPVLGSPFKIVTGPGSGEDVDEPATAAPAASHEAKPKDDGAQRLRDLERQREREAEEARERREREKQEREDGAQKLKDLEDQRAKEAEEARERRAAEEEREKEAELKREAEAEREREHERQEAQRKRDREEEDERERREAEAAERKRAAEAAEAARQREKELADLQRQKEAEEAAAKAEEHRRLQEEEDNRLRAAAEEEKKRAHENAEREAEEKAKSAPKVTDEELEEKRQEEERQRRAEERRKRREEADLEMQREEEERKKKAEDRRKKREEDERREREDEEKRNEDAAARAKARQAEEEAERSKRETKKVERETEQAEQADPEVVEAANTLAVSPVDLAAGLSDEGDLGLIVGSLGTELPDGASLTAKAVFEPTHEHVKTSVFDLRDGTQRVGFHPSKSGTYLITVELKDKNGKSTPVKGSPFSVPVNMEEVTAAVAMRQLQAAQQETYADLLSLQSGGFSPEGETGFTIQKPQSAMPISFRVKIACVAPQETEVPFKQEDAEEMAIVSFVPTISGDYKIEIDIVHENGASLPLQGSPFNVVLELPNAGEQVEFPEEILSGFSPLGVDPQEDKSVYFMVQYREPALPESTRLEAVVTHDGEVVDVEVADGGNGISGIHFLPKHNGQYSVQLRLLDDAGTKGNIKGSPFTVNIEHLPVSKPAAHQPAAAAAPVPAAAPAKHTEGDDDELAQSIASQTSADLSGVEKPRWAGECFFTVGEKGKKLPPSFKFVSEVKLQGEVVPSKVIDNKDGTHRVVFNTVRSGEYHFNVQVLSKSGKKFGVNGFPRSTPITIEQKQPVASAPKPTPGKVGNVYQPPQVQQTEKIAPTKTWQRPQAEAAPVKKNVVPPWVQKTGKVWKPPAKEDQ